MAGNLKRLLGIGRRLVALVAMLVIAGLGVSLILDQFNQSPFDRRVMLERSKRSRAPVIEIPIDITRSRGLGGNSESDFMSDLKLMEGSDRSDEDGDLLAVEDAEGLTSSGHETRGGRTFVLDSSGRRPASGAGSGGAPLSSGPGASSSTGAFEVSHGNAAVPSAGPIQHTPTQVARAPASTGTRSSSEPSAATQQDTVTQQGALAQQDTVKVSRPKNTRVTITGSDFLVAGQLEEADYGLYSYLLFAEDDANANARNRAAFEVFFTDPVSMGGVFSSRLDKSQINMTYIPISGEPPEGAGVEWFLENHDFKLSRHVLKSVDAPSSDGPYLVTSLFPLSGGESAASGAVLVQDLAWVTPEMTGRWVQAYLRDSGGARVWNELHLSDLMMTMRTSAIGISAPLGVSAAATAKDHIILK